MKATARPRASAWWALSSLLVPVALAAQPATRRATNIAALAAFPGFYHQHQIVLAGTVALSRSGDLTVSDDTGSVPLVAKANVPEGPQELRGEFWDVGRMKADDPRLVGIDLRRTFHIDPEGAWPRAGEVTAIIVSAAEPSVSPGAPSIRSIVLHPGRYQSQRVTIVGQFQGRNLAGDLPDAPGRSRYDFVLRSADAAIWVTNIRPKGKAFDLALDARLDTGRWLEVSGVVQQGRGLLWVDAEANSLALAKPRSETPLAEPIRVAAAPPPEVIFSAPTQDESDVALDRAIRIQFSRDIDAATLKDRIRASYLADQSIERGEPTTPKAEFTYRYLAVNRELEIRFTRPLERFRTIKVELLEGVAGTDQQALKPWTLTFAMGGS